MSCAHNDWRPVSNMRAVYRCAECGMFAYKQSARVGFGECKLVPYKCFYPGCDEPVEVMFQDVRARRTLKPACGFHRG